MFRRRKEESGAPEPPAAEQTPAPAPRAAAPSLIAPQPAAAERPPAPAAAIRPEAPRPAPPAAATPPVAPSADEEAKRLVVGKGIVLNGEITACDWLVVEGRVEATLSKTRSVEISPTGVFKGSAEIEQATIAGLYDGKLNCRGKLTIRSSGRVQGVVRYGDIEIELGGVICGDVGAATG